VPSSRAAKTTDRAATSQKPIGGLLSERSKGQSAFHGRWRGGGKYQGVRCYQYRASASKGAKAGRTCFEDKREKDGVGGGSCPGFKCTTHTATRKANPDRAQQFQGGSNRGEVRKGEHRGKIQARMKRPDGGKRNVGREGKRPRLWTRCHSEIKRTIKKKE